MEKVEWTCLQQGRHLWLVSTSERRVTRSYVMYGEYGERRRESSRVT